MNEPILVLGGSGFIGRSLVPRLDAAGHPVTVPTRNRERARGLILLPQATVVQADIHDPAALDALVAGHSIVINLVGILHGRAGGANDPYGPDFRKAHVTLAENLIASARRHGVSRLIQVSALGLPAAADTPPGQAELPSQYLRSKAEAERLIRASGLPYTIFRPSVIFGPDDELLNVFARLQRLAPLLLVPGLNARFQPVWVDDVVNAILRSLTLEATIGRTFELAGPEVMTLGDLVRFAGAVSGNPRPVLAMPTPLARLFASVMQCLPGKPVISHDNLRSMQVDNVATGPIDPLLGIQPASLRTLAPEWLAPLDTAANIARARRN